MFPEKGHAGEPGAIRAAIFTIVSNNYLHYARTLLQSAAEHHPECARFCVIVDQDLSHAGEFPDEFTLVRLSDLELPDPEQFIFRYSILELNTAVKPWAFAHLFELGFQSVLYIDPDIRIYSPLHEAFSLLEEDADIVVTPHLVAPMDDDREPTELMIRRAGTYNFGFCGLSNSRNSDRFLAWWKTKLEFDCVVDQPRGIFVDQSWIDLVPGLFPRVSILRHVGYNVAYWNLAQRVVRSRDGRWMVNDERLVFFHFSGFNVEHPHVFSKHQNRFSFENMHEEKQLAVDYAASLMANGAMSMKALPYGFATFANGTTTIPDLFRKVYREDAEVQQRMGANPFDHPDILASRIKDGDPVESTVTYAMYAVWKARADVREEFSLTDGDSILRFFEWFKSEGPHYFSQDVVDAHTASMKRLAAPTPSKRGGVAVVVRSRLVHRLYFTLLGREPDELGLRIHAAAANSRFSGAKVYLGLVLSRESRRKPGWVGRAIRGARVLMRNDGTAGANASANSSPRRRTHVDGPAGWFVADRNVAEEGCWVAPEARLPCVVRPGQTLSVVGVYPATLIRAQNETPSAEFSIIVDERELVTKSLDREGAFSISVRVPDSFHGGLASVHFVSSLHFVPKTIGLNADERRLAWRASRIAVDDVVLLEKTRTPVLLPLEQIARPDGVNVIGYIAAESGIGESARSFVKGCRAVDLPHDVVDVGYQNRNRQEDKSVSVERRHGERFKINILHVNADQTQTTLAAIGADARPSDANIGYWHWEQTALPTHYLSSFDGLDEVWTPSAFVQDAVAKISPIPVFKVPHVVEFAIPEGDARAGLKIPEGMFTALIMYDFDSYQFRKNPQAAIAAFRQVASNRADIGLVIKTINGDRDEQARGELMDSIADLKHVFFIDRYQSRQDVYALQNSCDCLISLHRCEGFGLGLAEMMYLGKPVIATGWSGNLEFMTPMNSLLVDYELRPLEQSLGVYQSGQPWAEADIDHAAHGLRRLVDDPTWRRRIGTRAGVDMRKNFSASVVGSLYARRLALLALRHS